MQRKNLRALGVDNGRVLDITYPAKTIIGLLVHNLYVDELIQTMATAGVHHITYDPQDGANLTNPEYDHLSSEEKNQIAITKHNHRLNRALPHIRLPVSKTIALFFHTKGWITDEQLTTHIAFCDEQIQTQRNKKHKGKQSTTTTSTRTPPPAKPAVASTATDNQMDTTEDMPVTVDGNTNTAIFITETWLLPNASLPTTWAQYHVYGEQVENTFRGQMGITLLINPRFQPSYRIITRQHSTYHPSIHSHAPFHTHLWRL
ncbi:MAG: hypothetical protein EXX96DRAFT_568929 [Benjaminiella poitrasii]|nr:MAG: hypothetical protein EXX96DRAFT_568929 [Benjaminiella poitrasii]